MGFTQVKIDDHLHEKMRELAPTTRGGIIAEYREAINAHIEKKTKETLIEDSKIEEFLNVRITKSEDHLASMMAKNMMDVSMCLMAIVNLIEKISKESDRSKIMESIRKEGYYYFSKSIKEDKDRKAKSTTKGKT